MRFLILLSILGTSASAQQAESADWMRETNLPALKTAGLNAEQKAALLKLLREESCSCPCTMKVAECRVKDPACRDSRSLATIAADEFRSGKSATQVRALFRNTAELKARREALANAPVEIPIGNSPVKGPANARVTIVEFSDFQCPYCRVAAKKAYDVLALFPNDVRLVFKQFPLDESHPQAVLAAEASLAANAQGKFWPLHDKMFANPRIISKDKVIAWAGELGMDVAKFTQDITTGKYKAQVNKEKMEGVNAGVSGTPTFYMNGRLVQGDIEPAEMKPLIEAELKKRAR
jgi:protein-disulfide isomerase